MKNRTAGAVALTAYVAAIVAANTSHYGMAGFALLARDFVHEYAGVRWVLLGIDGTFLVFGPDHNLVRLTAWLTELSCQRPLEAS